MGWTWALDSDTWEHAGHLQLTEAEATLLCRFQYQQDKQGPLTMWDVACPDPERPHKLDDRLHEAHQSLSRFGYLVTAEPRIVRHAAVADVLSDAAVARLVTMRARTYKCCGYAIRLPCVCTERTYCPEHRSGCHGTHD